MFGEAFEDLETYTKASCPLAEGMVNLATGTPYATCPDWNENVLDTLTGPDRPDLLLVSSSSHTMSDGGSLADGLSATWGRLRDAGVGLAVIADTPQPGVGGAECVAEHPDRSPYDLGERGLDRIRPVFLLCRGSEQGKIVEPSRDPAGRRSAFLQLGQHRSGAGEHRRRQPGQLRDRDVRRLGHRLDFEEEASRAGRGGHRASCARLGADIQ